MGEVGPATLLSWEGLLGRSGELEAPHDREGGRERKRRNQGNNEECPVYPENSPPPPSD